MKKKIKDERVELSKLMIYKEGMFVIQAVAILSLFQKIFIFKTDLSNCIYELIFLVISVAYILFRNLWLGNLITVAEKVNKKVVILSTFIASFAGTFIFAINNFSEYSSKYTGIFDGLFWVTVLLMFIQQFVICAIGFYFLGKKAIKDNNLED